MDLSKTGKTIAKLRRSAGFTQASLAEKLGISRQAVSKWERAEASPDTDNLILLARLYGVSLDELLKTEDEIPMPEENEQSEESNYSEKETWGDGVYSGNQEKGEYVHVGFQGVHVKDQNGEVHVGWDGIHVDDKKKGDNVHIDKNGVYVNGQKYDKEWFSHHRHFPMGLLITVIYVVIGCVWNAWHPGWLLFFLIPIWYSLVDAIEKRNASHFAYPVLVTLIFLCLGFFHFAWHPGWVIFLTIPLYYSFVEYLKAGHRRRQNRDENEQESREEGSGEADE